MQPLKMSCPCHFGLESVLSFEIKQLGGEDVAASDGRVNFTGGWELLARANLALRTAERVQIVMGEFPARSFDELFEGVRALPWEQFLARRDAFPVKGHSLNSALHSVPDCQAIVKKAVVERLKSRYAQTWFEETGAVHQIQFVILKDVATILFDTSGVGLHKRGYRKNANEAPIKETLAAGIVDLARIRADSIVCDPFCGSGTLLIEAATRAMNIAPCLNRKFAAEHWGCIPRQTWEDERAKALGQVRRDVPFTAYGSDIDAEAVTLTLENAHRAGIESCIKVKQAPISKFSYDGYGDKVTVLCNPPYGDRMLELEQAREIYETLGQVMAPSSKRPLYVITADEDFERLFGRKADRRRKLYNGMIRCQLYLYFKDVKQPGAI